MKIDINTSSQRRRGLLMLDLAMAVIVLSAAILPLAFLFAKEREALRADYLRANADEIVDGEMEILAAGSWKNYPDGSQVYPVDSHSAANLPAGHFELTKAGHLVRLEWIPDKHQGIGIVAREMNVP